MNITHYDDNYYIDKINRTPVEIPFLIYLENLYFYYKDEAGRWIFREKAKKRYHFREIARAVIIKCISEDIVNEADYDVDDYKEIEKTKKKSKKSKKRIKKNIIC